MPTLQDAIAAHFDAETIARGLAYARERRVLAATVHGERLHGVVVGTRHYTCSVDLAQLRLGLGMVTVDAIAASCTCPIASACKHAVAALAVMAHEHGIAVAQPRPASAAASGSSTKAEPARPLPSSRPGPDLASVLTEPWRSRERTGQHWLDQLASTAELRSTVDHRLVYALQLDEHGRLTVELSATRPLKNGRRGLAKRFGNPRRVLEQRPDYLAEDDLAILGQLAATPEHYYEIQVTSGHLLGRILATGRAVWGDHLGPPATAAAPCRVTPRWMERDGSLRIALHDDAGAEIAAIMTTPPWCRRGEALAPLASGLPDALLARLARMPWLHPAEAALTAPVLADAAPDLVPPLPGPAMPVPILRVWRQRVELWSGRGSCRREAELAVVGFRYGEHEALAVADPLLALPDGGPLVRNRAAEERRLDELERLGLVPCKASPVPAPRLPGAVPILASAEANHPGTGPAPIPPAVLAALRGSGWTVIGASGDAEVEVIELAEVSARVDDQSGRDWFELHLGIEVAGRRIDLVPLLTPLLRGGRLSWKQLPPAGGDQPAVLVTCGDRTVLRVPLELLSDLHDRLVEVFDQPPGPGGGWRIAASRADLIEEFDRLSPRWLGSDRLRGLAERLRACSSPPPVAAPAGLRAELRPYQRDGLAWLQQLARLGLGGVLADDMGLGKTVQTIAHLLAEREAGHGDRPSLVVCPASMVGTWRNELERFALGLRVAVWHGAGRNLSELAAAEVTVTTHATLVRDIDHLRAIPWHVAVCDEAQALKNAGTRTAAAIRRLEARQRLCLTGTPVENHLGDLHALLGWVAPGVLGGAESFRRVFREPIEDHGDAARRELLRRRVAPFLLRRTKEAVAAELPSRTDIDLPVDLGPEQRRLYETLRLAMDERVREAISSRGLARSGMAVLEALLRLRQACCDPRLLPKALARGCDGSAKLEALAELLATALAEGRRLLVYSQFTSLLDLVEREVLAPLGAPWLRLDGASRDRQRLVDRFQRGEAAVFLLSLKAGGTGLTLTAADTVVLLDPWWNPATERQAADRIHRIGQDKPVLIYRLIATGTVEERIRQLQRRKTGLAEALVDESGQALGRLDAEDVAALLAPLPVEPAEPPSARPVA